jgi:hypothetical protein
MHGRYSTWKAAILKKLVSINKMPNGYFPHIMQSLMGKTIRMNCISLYNPNRFPINVPLKCNNNPVLIFLFLTSRSISITLGVRRLSFIWDMGQEFALDYMHKNKNTTE